MSKEVLEELILATGHCVKSWILYSSNQSNHSDWPNFVLKLLKSQYRTLLFCLKAFF